MTPIGDEIDDECSASQVDNKSAKSNVIKSKAKPSNSTAGKVSASKSPDIQSKSKNSRRDNTSISSDNQLGRKRDVKADTKASQKESKSKSAKSSKSQKANSSSTNTTKPAQSKSNQVLKPTVSNAEPKKKSSKNSPPDQSEKPSQVEPTKTTTVKLAKSKKV